MEIQERLKSQSIEMFETVRDDILLEMDLQEDGVIIREKVMDWILEDGREVQIQLSVTNVESENLPDFGTEITRFETVAEFQARQKARS